MFEANAPVRNLRLYDLLAPDNNHKVLAQIVCCCKVYEVRLTANIVKADWHQGLDIVAHHFATKVFENIQRGRITAGNTTDFILSLLQLQPHQCQKLTENRSMVEMKSLLPDCDRKVVISQYSQDGTFLPACIGIKMEHNDLSSLSINQWLAISDKDMTEDCRVDRYVIKQGLNAGEFSKVTLAQDQENDEFYAVEFAELDSDRHQKQFDNYISIANKLASSRHMAKLVTSFTLQNSKLGCLVIELADADLKYKLERFREGLTDFRCRVIAYQILSILEELDQNFILHTSMSVCDLLYFERHRMIKGSALERAELVPNSQNNVRLVSNFLEYIICWDRYEQSKRKPEWLSDDMFDFIKEALHSNESAQQLKKRPIFSAVAESPYLDI